jgi:hypothetical protein
VIDFLEAEVYDQFLQRGEWKRFGTEEREDFPA